MNRKEEVLKVLNELNEKIDIVGGDNFVIDDLLTFSRYNILGGLGMYDEVHTSYMNLLESIIHGMLIHGIFDDEFFSDVVTNKAKIQTIIKRLDSYLPSIGEVRSYFPEDYERRMNNSIRVLSFFVRRLLHHLTPNFELKEVLSSQELADVQEEIVGNFDKRLSPKAPTSKQRIKALKVFCPDLFSLLSGKGTSIQEQVIHLITGVNLVDSYKYSFGARSRQVDEVEIENLNELLENLK